MFASRYIRIVDFHSFFSLLSSIGLNGMALPWQWSFTIPINPERILIESRVTDFFSFFFFSPLSLIQVAGLLHEHFSTKTQSTSLSSFVYGEASLVGEKSSFPPRTRDKEMSWPISIGIVKSSIDLSLDPRWAENAPVELDPEGNESRGNNSPILLIHLTLYSAEAVRLPRLIDRWTTHVLVSCIDNGEESVTRRRNTSVIYRFMIVRIDIDLLPRIVTG